MKIMYFLKKIVKSIPYILVFLPPTIFVIRFSSDDLDTLTFLFSYSIVLFLWTIFLFIIFLLFFYLFFAPFFNIKDIVNKK